MYFLFKCPADRNTSNTIRYNQILQKIFCLICIDLFDFSRSDLSFMPVIERQSKCGIPMKTIMVALLRLRSATDIASHRTKPKIQVSCGQKFIRYNQILQKIFCLICVNLFDFSRSDLSFMPVTERWLVSVVEPSRSERWQQPKLMLKNMCEGDMCLSYFC